MRTVLHSAAETQRIAQKIARALKPQGRRATTLALTGELGSGKTTFVQGLAGALGVTEKILSPTFILMRQHKVVAPTTERKRRRTQPFKVTAATLWHIDCYRVEKPAELVRLGLKDILKDPKNIVVVEWADRVRRLLPKDTMWVYFEHGEGENERVVSVGNRNRLTENRK